MVSVAVGSESVFGIRGVDKRERMRRRLMLFGWFVFSVSVLLSLSVGATGISLDALPSAFVSWLEGGTETEVHALVLLDIRLPRTLLAVFVGASLAVSGALMQGLFRNPLADPGLLGVSSGAALGAVSTIALSGGLMGPWVAFAGPYALPVAAFLGGAVATSFLVILARRRAGLMIATMLLAGIALAAMAEALMGIIAFVSDDRELRDLTLWRLGSLAGASWNKVVGILPFAVILALIGPRLVRGLNGLLLGEAEAFHLGVDVERTKRLVVLATAASVGAAVAVAGILGFIGIVVPHFVRLISGPDHRIVLPASAILGASLALLADVIARVVVAPAELPLGIVMAAIGAPVFLHLVLKRGAVLVE
jgi:heme transport system permease protein